MPSQAGIFLTREDIQMVQNIVINNLVTISPLILQMRRINKEHTGGLVIGKNEHGFCDVRVGNNVYAIHERHLKLKM